MKTAAQKANLPPVRIGRRPGLNKNSPANATGVVRPAGFEKKKPAAKKKVKAQLKKVKAGALKQA